MSSIAIHEADQLLTTGKDSFARYQHSGSHEDLDESIQCFRRAVDLATVEGSRKAVSLMNLGNSLSLRFTVKGQIPDISASIDAGTAAVELVSDTSTDKPAYLANLGNALRQRFNRQGDISDADRAVDVYRRTVELMHDGDARRPLFFMNYGLTLRARFEVTGHSADLEEAINFTRQAIALIPRDHMHHAACLNNLGLCLIRHFERSLDPKDIDEAVELCKLSVQITRDNDMNKAARWHTLATALDTRFVWLNLRDNEQLDAAVFAAQQAVQATPDGHPRKPTCLSTLSLALYRRSKYASEGHADDADDMVTVGLRAVELCPDDSLEKATHLDTLGIVLLESYLIKRDNAILDAAVYAARQAAEASNMTDSRLGWRLYHLAIALNERFSLSKQREDIDLAINVAKLAVGSVLPEDGLRSTSFHLLAYLLQRSHDALGTQLDSDTRLSALEVVATSPGPAQSRFEGARFWAAALMDSRGPAASLPAWKLVIELIPKVIWLGRGLEDRYNLSMFESVQKALLDAVEVTVDLDDGTVAGYSVEWLEERRCVIWGQYDDLRAPLDLIRASDACLAEELEFVSGRLASFDADWTSASVETILPPGQQRPDSGLARRALAMRFEVLVDQVRELPRCQGFLRQRSLADLQPAAAHTPIIMLLQHDGFCRVIAQLPPGNQYAILKVKFTRKMAERILDAIQGSYRTTKARGDTGGRASFTASSNAAQRRDDFEKALRILWIHLVRPILDAIKPRLKSGASGELPRVTWSPSGILSFLPLHAAGIYSGDAHETAHDRVVSSYTPNLTVLLNAERRRASIKDPHTTAPKILAISQPNTPGQPALPGTRIEVQKLADMVSNVTWLNGQNATRNTVLEQMKDHAWVHLACHGVQDTERFTNSSFMLDDGPLRLVDIMAQSFEHTQLAFLSACQTATGDRRFPGESLHLAAGLLNAGFGSVCATMWSIQDEDGPIVSDHFYTSLLSDGGDSRRSAYALHQAVGHLREHVGVKKFERWVPFLHLGL